MSLFAKNIFEEAASLRKERQIETEADAKEEAPSPADAPLTSDEERWDSIQQKHQEMESQVERIYSMLNIPSNVSSKLLALPELFSFEQRQQIAQTKEMVDRQLEKLLGKRLKKLQQKEEEKRKGERRKKSIGARKKWLSMD
ncbi:MAG: hypothetical protein K0S07_1550 [Chlamydiales bacterium]|jgi:hypothetical protein|nr:hypothetical protein [Chlamydiales bacterium]